MSTIAHPSKLRTKLLTRKGTVVTKGDTAQSEYASPKPAGEKHSGEVKTTASPNCKSRSHQAHQPANSKHKYTSYRKTGRSDNRRTVKEEVLEAVEASCKWDESWRCWSLSAQLLEILPYHREMSQRPNRVSMRLVNTGLVIQGRRDTVRTLLLVCMTLFRSPIVILTLRTEVLA